MKKPCSVRHMPSVRTCGCPKRSRSYELRQWFSVTRSIDVILAQLDQRHASGAEQLPGNAILDDQKGPHRRLPRRGCLKMARTRSTSADRPCKNGSDEAQSITGAAVKAV